MTEDSLQELRNAFARFEKLLGDERAIHHLGEAIDLYLDIVEDENETDQKKTIATNIANTYRKLLIEKARELQKDKGTYDIDFYSYWMDLACEFRDVDIANDKEIRKATLDLFKLGFSTLSPDEKKEFLRDLGLED